MRTTLKRLLIYSVSSLIVLVLTVPFFLQWGLNTPVARRYITGCIDQKLAPSATIEDYNIILFPQPYLKFKDLIFYGESKQPVLKIQAGTIKPDPIQLLRGRLVIQSIGIEHPEIDKALFQFDTGSKTHSFVPAISQLKKKIFNFISTHLPQSDSKFQINIQNISSVFFKNLDLDINIDRPADKIILKMDINDIFLSKKDFGHAVLNDTLFQSASIANGRIFAILDAENKLSANLKLKTVLIEDTRQKTCFSTDEIPVRLHLDASGIKADIQKFNMQYPRMAFASHLMFDRQKQKSEIVFKGEEIQTAQVRKAALKLLPPNEVTDHLFDIVRGGYCPQISVHFQGTNLKDLFDENKMMLDASIEKGVIKIPETPLTAHNIKGYVSMNGGVLAIKTTAGMVNKAQLVKGSLDVDLLNYVDFPFEGKFVMDVDLSELPDTLISLLPETLLASELRQVHRITGQARAELDLLMKSSSDLIVNVKTLPFKTQGRYDRIPGNISIQNIEFEYKPDQVFLKHLDAIVHESQFSKLNAHIDFRKDYRIHILEGRADIALAPAINFLNRFEKTGRMIAPLKKGSGILYIDNINLSGDLLTPENWTYHVNGRGDHVHLSTDPKQEQIRNLSFTYDIRPGKFRFENIFLLAKDFQWLEQSKIKQYVDQIRLPLSLHGGQFTLTPAKALFKTEISTPTDVTLQLNASGKTLKDFSLNAISIKDQPLSEATYFKQDGQQSFQFSGQLSTRSLEKLLDPRSSWLEMINKITGGREMTISKTRDRLFELQTGQLDLDSLLSNTNKFIQDENIQFPRLTVQFSADRVNFKKLKFRSVNSKITFSDDGFYVRIKSADLCGLNPEGYISFQESRIYTNFLLSTQKNADSDQLLSCLLDKERFMNGHYSLTGRLSSGSHIRDVATQFKGQASFTAENGRIYKLTLLSRILSVLNVSNVFRGKIPDITQEGFAYKKIDIDVSIKKSIIHLEKAVLDGEDMTMIFSGTLDPVNDQINVTCLVAPFKTVDIIIQKVPIINTLMGGRLVSVPVKATGSLSDPNVIPLHPSAVGSGLITMMMNILKTPVSLLDKLILSDENDEEKQ